MAIHESPGSSCPDAVHSVPAVLTAEDVECFRPYLQLLAETSISRLLCGKLDAADIVQETLVRACENFSQFRGDSTAELAAWLRQILANTCTDLWRRYSLAESRQASRERSLDAILDSSSRHLESFLAATGTTPSQAAHRVDQGVLLADALSALSPEHRQVIALRSLQELSWDEVARAMQRSAGATRMLWVRALKSLRPLIEARLQ